MKPKLKVGDYAVDTITNDVYLVLNINKDGSVRLRQGNNFFLINICVLKKCSPTFAILPSLTELEQYRLSLEMYEQLMTELIMHYEYSQNMKSEKIVDAINEDYNTWQTLTEILEA